MYINIIFLIPLAHPSQQQRAQIKQRQLQMQMQLQQQQQQHPNANPQQLRHMLMNQVEIYSVQFAFLNEYSSV